MATYLGQALLNGNVLLTDKESNNSSHMIDILMCVCMLRLVNHMVCAWCMCMFMVCAKFYNHDHNFNTGKAVCFLGKC